MSPSHAADPLTQAPGPAGPAAPSPALPTAEDVLSARARMAGQLPRTLTRDAPRLAQEHGAAGVQLKIDTALTTGSFKERGALNAILSLTPEQAQRGVITASAGNHAQALAYHARKRGITVTVVMPAHTPKVKIAGARHLGAEVVLHGEEFDEALAEARRREAEEGLAFVHAFDDPAVIAGQGVAVLEMLEDAPDIDTLLVPIGGGGLISGALLAEETLRAARAAQGRPPLRILGVEPAMYPSMRYALGGRDDVPLGGRTIAEGVAVKRAGGLTMRVCRARMTAQEILTVSEPAIEEAVVALAMGEKLIAEGAGALGLAAMMEHRDIIRARHVGLMICGGNIDARLMAQVLARHLVRTRRRARLRVECLDQPGSLSRVSAILMQEGVNIIDVLHNRMVVDVPAKETRIDLVIETDDASITEGVVKRLRAEGFPGARILDERE